MNDGNDEIHLDKLFCDVVVRWLAGWLALLYCYSGLERQPLYWLRHRALLESAPAKVTTGKRPN